MTKPLWVAAACFRNQEYAGKQNDSVLKKDTWK